MKFLLRAMCTTSLLLNVAQAEPPTIECEVSGTESIFTYSSGMDSVDEIPRVERQFSGQDEKIEFEVYPEMQSPVIQGKASFAPEADKTEFREEKYSSAVFPEVPYFYVTAFQFSGNWRETTVPLTVPADYDEAVLLVTLGYQNRQSIFQQITPLGTVLVPANQAFFGLEAKTTPSKFKLPVNASGDVLVDELDALLAEKLYRRVNVKLLCRNVGK